jgi:transposase
MCLHPHAVPPIPEDTARVARAAFRKGNLFMRMRDEFGAIYADDAFASLFPSRGQSAESPWRLALVTVMQYVEGLSDVQAADAVRGHIDWKYALSLDLADPGFDASVLSEFRTRLISRGAEKMLFDLMLDAFRERKLLKARGRQRTDSTHVLAAIRAVNRLQCVGETMRHALNALAVAAPVWLQERSEPEWVKRYDRRLDDARLPEGKAARQALAETIGRDGRTLLAAVDDPAAPGWLREIPAIQILRLVWIQQYYIEDGMLRWRTDEHGIPPSSRFISSPYDLDAHLATKGTTTWIGYKVHLTESCDEDEAHLITNVETSSAPTADGTMTPEIHAALKDKDLLPERHIVDTGFLDAELLVESQRHFGVDLVGPTRADYKWQAREGTGFDAAKFAIDWEKQSATCPEGHTSISWSPALDKRTNDVIKIKFSSKDCRPCPSRDLCFRSQKRYARRSITVRTEAEYHALRAARQREATDEFKAEYAKRAGIEGTISQGVRAFRLRRSRYIGQAKTHLQHALTATAINYVRVARWLDDIPLAQTRQSPFVALMKPQLQAA